MNAPNSRPDPNAAIVIPPSARRTYPIDATHIAIEQHRFLEPEVNRLKEWAIRANDEIARETVMKSQTRVMGIGPSIGLMVIASISLWGALALGISALI